MHTLKLPRKWTSFLTSLPETGMGYQLVKVFLKNGVVLRNKKVMNASYLVLQPDQEIREEEIEKIELEGK